MDMDLKAREYDLPSSSTKSRNSQKHKQWETISASVNEIDPSWKPAPQPRRCVTGMEPLKRFFEDEMGQSAANIDSHLQKLREEHVLEIRDVVLFDGTPMKFRLE